MSSGSPSATPPFKTSARNPLPPAKVCTTTKGIPGVSAGDSSACPHKQTWLESQNQEIHLFFHLRKELFSPFEGENSFLSTVQSSSKKRMLHKARARNARPYGHGGVMHSCFFLQHCRGAHRAPVIGICAKFRICSFTVKKFSYSFICGKGYSPPSRGRIAFCLQSKESPAFPPGIPYTHLGFLITWQTPGRGPCRSPGSQPSRRRRYPRQRSGWR